MSIYHSYIHSPALDNFLWYCFIYHGIHCQQKIKRSFIFYTQNNFLTSFEYFNQNLFCYQLGYNTMVDNFIKIWQDWWRHLIISNQNWGGWIHTGKFPIAIIHNTAIYRLWMVVLFGWNFKIITWSLMHV
jgi:hypothetical protein